MQRLLLRLCFSLHLIEQKLYGMLHCQTWLPPTAVFGRGTVLLLILLILLELGFLSLTLGVLTKLLGSREISFLILNDDYTFKIIVVIAFFVVPTMFFFRYLRDKNEKVKTYYEEFSSEPNSKKRLWAIISVVFFALCTCFALASFLWCYHGVTN